MLEAPGEDNAPRLLNNQGAVLVGLHSRDHPLEPPSTYVKPIIQIYGYGYHGSPWGYGGTRTTVHQYTEANVYIDMVDSSEHKLVWQGVATFTVTDKMQQQLRDTVFNTVNEIFTEFPVPAPAAAN